MSTKAKKIESSHNNHSANSDRTYVELVHLQFSGRTIFRSTCGASLMPRNNRDNPSSLEIDSTSFERWS
jgi:hypothetical protein